MGRLLLPAWLEFGLQPARVERRRGLLSGAAPLLLPEAAPHHHSTHAAHGQAAARQRSGAPRSAGAHGEGRRGEHDDGEEYLGVGSEGSGLEADLVGGVMPARGVLARSEFLAPLDEDTAALHWAVLHPDLQRESL